MKIGSHYAVTNIERQLSFSYIYVCVYNVTELSAKLEGGADPLCNWSQLTGLFRQDLYPRICAPGSYFCHPALCVTSDKSGR